MDGFADLNPSGVKMAPPVFPMHPPRDTAKTLALWRGSAKCCVECNCDCAMPSSSHAERPVIAVGPVQCLLTSSGPLLFDPLPFDLRRPFCSYNSAAFCSSPFEDYPAVSKTCSAISLIVFSPRIASCATWALNPASDGRFVRAISFLLMTPR